MNPISVQSQKDFIQITLDRTLVPMDFLLDLLDTLQIEYLAKEINFSDDMLQIGEDIKREWWQKHKRQFLQHTAYAESRN